MLAATNIDLEQAVADGQFREDLYYRLTVVHLTLPPLRDRGQDMALLATALLQRYATERHDKLTGFDAQALLALQTHAWPGNVRELENRIKRAVIMAAGPRLTPADLELEAPEPTDTVRTLKEAREAVEKDLILQTLARHQGNVTRTAAALGVSRPPLHDLLTKLGLRR